MLGSAAETQSLQAHDCTESRIIHGEYGACMYAYMQTCCEQMNIVSRQCHTADSSGFWQSCERQGERSEMYLHFMINIKITS
jgi:hypothetical protein